MHIRRERNASRTSRNYSPRGKRAVYVLRMGGIKIPCPRPEVDESLIRGSGTDDKFRKERNVDGLGVNMIFGFRAWGFHEYEVMASIYMYGGLRVYDCIR